MASKYLYHSELISWREILLTTNDPDIIGLDLHIFKNLEEIYYELKTIENKDKLTFIHIGLTFDLNLADHFIIKTNNEFNSLDLSKAPAFKDFDERYSAKDAILGPTYTKDRTTFRLWAPLASKVNLKYRFKNTYKELEMNRCDRGVYELILEGDYDGVLYTYVINQNNEVFETIDPYAKSGSINMEQSAVIDLEKIKDVKVDYKLPRLDNYVDAIVYELHVRDFTIHKNSNIVHKGKFIGLCEKNRRTSRGNKAGIDYIKDLGVTHVQLLPVLSVATIDETKPQKTYNWGYDPYHYFTLEGSYSTNPKDPYSRLYEFKELVNTFHLNGLRVNLDVVYNHMFDKETILEKIVPHYYFRVDENYNFINQSFCGNAVASEKIMVHKLILDSTRYLFDTFDIDGFRFDLMGLTDAKTINDIYNMATSYKKDAMLYGEGWNMAGDKFEGHLMANMNNAKDLPNIGFFNDSYRNIARGNGGGAELNDNGYILGNISYLEGYKFALTASTINYVFNPIFVSTNQSINYVECHDNSTINDVIENSTDDNNDEKIRRIKLLNKSLLLSFGVPFIHAGQEIGLTKFAHHNTYNKGDKFNQFNYDTLDERKELVESFKNYIKQRREIPFYKISDPKLIEKSIKFDVNNNALVVTMDNKDISDTKYTLIINPTKNTIYLNFDDEKEDYIYKDRKNSKFLTRHAMVFPISAKIYK